MSARNDYTVRTEGSWGHGTDGSRSLHISVVDVNGCRILDLDIAAEAVIDILSSTHRGDGARSTLRFYGLQNYGKAHQVLNIKLPIDGHGLEFLEAAIEASSVLQQAVADGWDIRDGDHWNGHRYQTGEYQLSLSRFVDPPAAPAADLMAIATGTLYESEAA